MDIVHPWTLDPATGKPLVPITTFSVAMIHRQSGGRLDTFAHGIERLQSLKAVSQCLPCQQAADGVTEECTVGSLQVLSDDMWLQW